jgi:hypothetical protein
MLDWLLLITAIDLTDQQLKPLIEPVLTLKASLQRSCSLQNGSLFDNQNSNAIRSQYFAVKSILNQLSKINIIGNVMLYIVTSFSLWNDVYNE